MQKQVRKFLPELVYGANDGIITTFAIVASAIGAQLAIEVVLILGFASLLADGFSMATSSYLSERTASSRKGQSDHSSAVRYATATFVGFVVPGAIPLLTFLLPLPSAYQFPAAAVLTLLALFVVGASRAVASEMHWRRGGLEMLAVGALAATVAYAIGVLGSSLVAGNALAAGWMPGG